MNDFENKRHFNSRRKYIQRKLSKRIRITMAFQNNANWYELESPKDTRKKLKEEQKKYMIKI